MSGSGLHHVHVQMADASTSTAEDRETDIVVRGMSESPTTNFNYAGASYEQQLPSGTLYVEQSSNNSAFTFPRPIYGYASFNQTEDNIPKDDEREMYISDPYNDLRDEASILNPNQRAKRGRILVIVLSPPPSFAIVILVR